MDKTPIILTGPPGCGKSYWIQKYAEQVSKQLFVCACRKDRTLRDGRQKLHIWARRTEPAILWLEGADDLTPEAQAFLRRILETHASEVLFILECRDAGRLQEPIRSRCKIKKMMPPTWDDLESYLLLNYPSIEINTNEIKTYLTPNEYSYRRVNQCANLQRAYPTVWRETYDHRMKETAIISQMKSTDLLQYIKNGYHPDHLIHPLLNDMNTLKDYGKCIELSGSIWAFLGSALDKGATTTNMEEE
jgi:replication-associated recombination protein RarA